MQVSLESYDRIALICQGGGALGAYQIGVYEALIEKGIRPNFLVGISIGAFTAAIIAGNPEEKRLEKLRSFWDNISWPEMPKAPTIVDQMRTVHSKIASLQGVLFGQPNFFVPRFPGPALQPRGTAAATSYYDTSRLKTTLLSHIDFNLLNDKKNRLILGATRVKDAQLVFFDNVNTKITPEHIMASGAMPPGFPAVRVDGDLYWDGGCVSNTPLESMFNLTPRKNTLSFVIELFNTQGSEPNDMDEVLSRSKDILYTSRTDHHLQHLKDKHRLMSDMNHMLDHVNPEFKKTPAFQRFKEQNGALLFDVVHLMYDVKKNEERIKLYEFSKSSIKAREEQGYHDTLSALKHLNFDAEPPRKTQDFRHVKFLGGKVSV